VHIEKDQWRFLGVIAVLLVLFGVGVWVPATMERSRLMERIQRAEADLAAGTGETEELRRLTREVADLREVTRRPQRYVPEQDELAEVLKSLTESLAAPGVRVSEIVVSDPKDFRDYSVIPVTLSFDGPFLAAFEVLNEIESLSRMVRFDDLSFAMDPRRPSADVGVSLKLVTFFSPTAEGGRR
jgi:Tfp pilus assembly protein PilO